MLYAVSGMWEYCGAAFFVIVVRKWEALAWTKRPYRQILKGKRI